MKRLVLLLAVVVAIAVTQPLTASTRITRELKRMVGYTIVSSSTIKSITPSGEPERVVVLHNGLAFRFNLSLTLSLTYSDVIVFVEFDDGKPRRWKLMFDDGEFVDATLLK